MDKILTFLSGNRTYVLVFAGLMYCGIMAVNGTESDQAVINALLLGGLGTVRAGVANKK